MATLVIPPKPAQFSPSLPPPGYRVKLLPFNSQRPKITPRLQLAHTNGASRAGSIEASYNHAMGNLNPGYIYGNPAGSAYNTIPHFQVDLDGDAAMMIELDRKGIAVAQANGFCISYETADTGYLADPTISPYTDAQLQAIAVGFAYCSMLWKINLAYPATWDGNGSASHTKPFGYPQWTNVRGKICPGLAKKAQMEQIILPWATQIVQAWSGVSPAPTPPTTDPPKGIAAMGVPLVLRFGGTPSANWSGYYSFDGVSRQSVFGMHHAAQLQALGALDAKTLKPVTSATWTDVTHTLNPEELDEWLTPGRDN